MAIRRQLRAAVVREQEADAWAEETRLQRDAAIEECDSLAAKNASLQALTCERTRQLLARSYEIIECNVEWKKRGE